jgi:Fe2+ transport system protein FeoA
MVRLDEVEENKCCCIRYIEGDGISLGKLLPLGISVGNHIEVVYNRRFIPILLSIGDSFIAVSRRKAQTIFVEEDGNDR